MPASKAQQAATALRRAQCIQLRLAGLDYQTIAERLRYSSRQAAAKDVERALQRAVLAQHTSVEELRELELMRLDKLQAAMWKAAMEGDPRAVEVSLKISSQRCKLLGLDAPLRAEVITLDHIDAEIVRLQNELGRPGASPEAPGAAGSPVGEGAA